MTSSGQLFRYFSGRNWLRRITTASICALMAVLAIAVAGCGGSHHSHFQPHHFSFSTAGGLWVANGSNVLEFGDTFTSRTPNIAPNVVLTNSAGFLSTQGVLFDTAGDLWVIDGGAIATSSTGDAFPALDEFSAAELAPGGSLDLTPTVQITGDATGLLFPQQAVFDSTGNMWVTDNSAGDVDVFSADQLVTGGNIAPFATLTATGSNLFAGPLGIVFDSSGDLWVANNADTDIFEFDATTVATVLSTGGPNLAVPDVVLSTSSSSIEGPWALIFDPLGDLISSNANTPFTVVAFSPADLAASGSPTPLVTLSSVNVKGVPSLNSPNGIALDNANNGAVANSIPIFSIAIYSASQLPGAPNPNLSPKPEVLISGSSTDLAAPAGDVFGPLIP